MTANVGFVLQSQLASWAGRAAAALLVAAPVIAVLAIRRRLPTFVLVKARAWAWTAYGVSLAVTLASGGAHSAAMPVASLSVWALVDTVGWGTALAAAAGALLTLAAHALWMRLPLPMALLGPAGTIAFAGFLPPWFGWSVVRRIDRQLRRHRRLQAEMAALVPSMPSHATVRREDIELSADRELIARDLGLLEDLLRDIRDSVGANEAIFWKYIPERARSSPYGWSTEGAERPMFFTQQAWRPLIRWTAEEERAQLEGDGDIPRFAAAPVITGNRVLGVLSLTSENGLGMSRDETRTWIPRYARQVARLLDLCEFRLEYGRQVRRNEQLLEAMKRLQEHKRAESLGPAICEHAIAVTSATAAALVRWVGDENRGTVQFASDGLGLLPGAEIGVDTLVADACRAGTTLVLEDARVATAGKPLYVAGGRRQVASLAIVPLVHDRRVIGALVVEDHEPGALSHEDAQVLELLGGSVHGSLEVVWEIEEVTRRAHTDALTGLANRRHFDEQLKAALARTDRSGSPCSLVLVDLDHFKLVNDTYGHEAGDAVLRQVAHILSEGIRTVDVCARYGGEEMAILLPDTDSTGAAELAERLRHSIAVRAVKFRAGTVPVTASFGVASFPETVLHGDSLFPAADRALYAAKADGRNRVKVASARASRTTPST